MNIWLLIALAAGAIFCVRWLGFTLRFGDASPFWKHFLRFVPISVFAAIVVSSLYRDSAYVNIEVIAIAVAGTVTWRTKRFLLGVATGLGVFWLLLFLGGR